MRVIIRQMQFARCLSEEVSSNVVKRFPSFVLAIPPDWYRRDSIPDDDLNEYCIELREW